MARLRAFTNEALRWAFLVAAAWALWQVVFNRSC